MALQTNEDLQELAKAIIFLKNLLTYKKIYAIIIVKEVAEMIRASIEYKDGTHEERIFDKVSQYFAYIDRNRKRIRIASTPDIKRVLVHREDDWYDES